MSKAQIADYPYFREIYSDVSINCYTGGVQSLIKAQGKDIPEYVIWTLGKGFAFLEAVDEYGEPEISFKLFDIVKEFSKVFGCKLNAYPIDYNNFKEQLASFLDNEQQLLVWVNSQYMSYSDLYYSNRGYLHAIVLESFDKKNNLARVKDNLVVSMPPWSCNADLPYEDLYKAVSDRVKSPSIDVMGFLHTITLDKETTPITAGLLRNALLNSSAEILEEFNQNKSVIIKYGERCCKYMNDCDDDKKLWMLRRINDNIKTLYVLPNRILLSRVLENIGLDSENYASIKIKLDEVLNSWTILANLCLKCYVSKGMKALSMLPSCFDNVKRSEEIFWNALNKMLGDYHG